MQDLEPEDLDSATDYLCDIGKSLNFSGSQFLQMKNGGIGLEDFEGASKLKCLIL